MVYDIYCLLTALNHFYYTVKLLAFIVILERAITKSSDFVCPLIHIIYDASSTGYM